MGTTSEKLTYLNTTKGLIKDKLNLGGANITTEPFRQYSSKLMGIYKDFLAHSTDTLWNNWEKVSGTGTELSLNNTMEGKMKIDLKGNTQQGNLPSGYTQVDYIKKSGNTQYIDTNVIPTANTKIDLDFSYDGSSGTSFSCLFGERSNVSNTSFGVYIQKNSNTGKIAVNYSYFDGGSTSTTFIDINKKYNIKNNAGNWYIDDVLKTDQSTTAPLTTSTNSIYLFEMHQADGTPQARDIQAKIYRCKFYESATLTRDFIPCYRNSDNEIGLYDIVGNQFYTNAGTGTFTKGSNAPTPSTPIDIQVVSGDNTIKVEGKNLFDKDKARDNYYYDNSGNKVVISGYDYININYMPIPTQNKITISFTSKTENAYVRIVEYNSSGTFIKRTLISSNTTTTLDSNTKSVIFCVDSSSIAYFTDLQIELGNQTTSYTPYQSATYPISLGNIELCKIGTYQDKIYKDNGKWYLNKQIGKVVLNGSSASDFSGADGSFTYIVDIGMINANIDTLGYLKCNYYQEMQNYKMYDSSVNYGITRYTPTGTYNFAKLVFKNIDINNTNSFANWLSTHNTIVYYVLATPTNTEITDTTLLNQLNNLYNANSYNNTTNVSQVNDDMPFVLDITALKEMA